MPTHPFCDYEVPIKTCRKCAFSALCLVGIDITAITWRGLAQSEREAGGWRLKGGNSEARLRMRCVHEKTMGDTKPRRRR